MESEQHNRDTTTVPFQIKAIAAIIGAAVGDALGWPEEGRATLATRKAAGSRRGEFVPWSKRAGGRFYAHEEEIGRGEYSDDTQLIVATARSLIESPDWFRVFTEIELPLWTAYERGGGGATKRAAESWLSGRPPWDASSMDLRRYFDAGGNGVVMRILPHCVWETRATEFAVVAGAIVQNGVSTHGHPRALVGALAYGFAVWHQLRSSATLGYGALVDLLLDSHQVWSTLPDSIPKLSDWLAAAEACFNRSYLELWQKTVDEQLHLLEMAKAGMSKGALAVDQEVLRALGCYDKRVSGSGTIAAAAAVFLSSRYAADPMNGVLEAAYSRGADTDTLASLVGGLLGAVNGIEWLGPLADEVQDAGYLRTLARSLCDRLLGGEAKRQKVSEGRLKQFLQGIRGLSNGQAIALPDGQRATVVAVGTQPVGSGKTDRVVAWCRTAVGQSLQIHTMEKSAGSRSSGQRSNDFEPVGVDRIVLRMRVHDLEQARQFYVNALGLKITKEQTGMVTLGGVLALSSRDASSDQQTLQFGSRENQPVHLYIETKHLDAMHHNVKRVSMRTTSPISTKDNRRHFTCFDPDGNMVEIFEARSKGQS
ncbi:MAG: ADP-ribosylglycohydrolase family protein [Bryobacteraceae bacterium]|nr:ADP-ribosylglycohydrolase family protein [Bryobacteraceae bacterium]